MERAKEHGWQVLSLVLLTVVWEVAARTLDSTGLPPATEVAVNLWGMLADGSAFGPLASTLSRTALGFLFGFIAGVIYGIAVYTSPRFGEWSRGLFNIAMFAPTLIIIFVGLAMLGNSYLTVVVLIAFVISTDVGSYMRDAFRDFDQDLVDMASSYKVGLPQRIRSMYLPYLVPPMLAAGRIGFTLAWKVAFLAEVFGYPEGLGWRVRNSYTVYDMTALLSWLTLFVITLLLVEQLTRFSERALVKW